MHSIPKKGPTGPFWAYQHLACPKSRPAGQGWDGWLTGGAIPWHRFSLCRHGIRLTTPRSIACRILSRVNGRHRLALHPLTYPRGENCTLWQPVITPQALAAKTFPSRQTQTSSHRRYENLVFAQLALIQQEPLSPHRTVWTLTGLGVNGGSQITGKSCVSSRWVLREIRPVTTPPPGDQWGGGDGWFVLAGRGLGERESAFQRTFFFFFFFSLGR